MLIKGWMVGRGEGILEKMDGDNMRWFIIDIEIENVIVKVIGVRFLRERKRKERKRGVKV